MSVGKTFQSIFGRPGDHSSENPSDQLTSRLEEALSSPDQFAKAILSADNLPSGQEDQSRSKSESLGKVDEELSEFSVDRLLLKRIDEKTIALLDVVDNDSMLIIGAGESLREVPQYTFQEKMKALEFAKNWAKDRRKLDSAGSELDDGFNIEKLREAVEQITEATIEKKNLVSLPPKKNGRPTKEEAAQKKTAMDALQAAQAAQVATTDDGDDSELKRALRGEK
jgi:hypothetical protein